jgi:protein-(glutamine-N5) methyltransferase, release factor-specific
MNIGEAERYLNKELSAIYDERESYNIADILIEELTGFNKSDRIIKKNEILEEGSKKKLEQALSRLIKHEPIQYVINKAWFYGIELYVDSSVLIPRPETEELVEWIIKDIQKDGKDVFVNKPVKSDETDLLKIADIGTGSGCIALALKKTMPRAEVWGFDHSEAALTVARRNGSSLDIRVDFQGVNFLDYEQHKFLPSVDIIVSNPPYISVNDSSTLNANVVNFEPHMALFVPDNDPLIFYKALIHYSRHRLHKNGRLYMEINEEAGDEIKKLFNSEGMNNTEIKKDLQGKNRMVRVLI